MDGSGDNGASTMIEDYFNADPAFDLLIDHPKTMTYINTIIQERPTINNSEIRLRYPHNYSGSHQPGVQQSGPPKGKYQYQVSNGEVDCKMVRMVYFVDDVTNDGGATNPHLIFSQSSPNLHLILSRSSPNLGWQGRSVWPPLRTRATSLRPQSTRLACRRLIRRW